MVRVLLALLFLCGVAQSRDLAGNNGLIMAFDPSFPKALRPSLTFKADLTSNLKADGRGSTVPTYTRNSVASYISPSTGLISYVVANEPRFEANSYLSEDARTNALKDSAGFVNGWTRQRVVVYPATSPSIVGPDGTSSTMYAIAEDNTSGTHRVFYSYTGTSAVAQSGSVYAKKGGRNILLIQMDDGGVGFVRRWFDLNTGLKVSSSVGGSASHWWEASSSITVSPNGWYRCVVVTGTATGTAKNISIFSEDADASVTYAGDNSSSLFVFGAQAEEGTFASSYIPTTSAAVARAADALTYQFAGNGGTGTGLITTNGTRGAFDASSAITVPVGFTRYKKLTIFGNTTLTDFEKAQLR